MDRYLHPSPQLPSLQGEESSEDDTLSEYHVPLWLHLWFHVFSASLAISSAIGDRMETRTVFEQRAAPKMAIGYIGNGMKFQDSTIILLFKAVIYHITILCK